MAEFQEVVRQIKRMCTKQNYCYECPMRVITCANGGNKPLSCIAAVCDDEVERLEKIVMDWAAAHPEPRYPSWNEAWKQLFPDGQKTPCPGCCGRKYAPEWCGHEECGKCKDRPIHADIAEKLGIKPIGGKEE